MDINIYSADKGEWTATVSSGDTSISWLCFNTQVFIFFKNADPTLLEHARSVLNELLTSSRAVHASGANPAEPVASSVFDEQGNY